MCIKNEFCTIFLHQKKMFLLNIECFCLKSDIKLQYWKIIHQNNARLQDS